MSARGFRVEGPFEEGEWLAWDVEIEPDWKAFDGHFPGRPILPAIGHLFLIGHLLETARGTGASITSVDRFRIASSVLPGARLRVRVELRTAEEGARFTIDNAGGRSSEASFQWRGGIS